MGVISEKRMDGQDPIKLFERLDVLFADPTHHEFYKSVFVSAVGAGRLCREVVAVESYGLDSLEARVVASIQDCGVAFGKLLTAREVERVELEKEQISLQEQLIQARILHRAATELLCRSCATPLKKLADRAQQQLQESKLNFDKSVMPDRRTAWPDCCRWENRKYWITNCLPVFETFLEHLRQFIHQIELPSLAVEEDLARVVPLAQKKEDALAIVLAERHPITVLQELVSSSKASLEQMREANQKSSEAIKRLKKEQRLELEALEKSQQLCLQSLLTDLNEQKQSAMEKLQELYTGLMNYLRTVRLSHYCLSFEQWLATSGAYPDHAPIESFCQEVQRTIEIHLKLPK